MAWRWIPGAALLLAALVAQPASADGTATISGRIINATPSGGSVDGLQVRLHTLGRDTGRELEAPATLEANAEGAFSFGGLDTVDQRVYVLRAEYAGVGYTAEPVFFQEGESARAVELKVYETTPSPDAIQLRGQHLVIDPDAERKLLRVLDISIVQNGGDSTFVGRSVGAWSETFRLLLPPGARNVELGDGMEGSIVEVPGGLAYTAPLLPGQSELVYSYAIEYAEPNLTLAKPLALSADAVDVFVADRGERAASPNLTLQSPVELGGQRYLHLAGKRVSARDPITLQFSELPGVAPAPTLPVWWPALPALALAGLSYVLVARRRAARQPSRLSMPREAEEFDAEELLAQ